MIDELAGRKVEVILKLTLDGSELIEQALESIMDEFNAEIISTVIRDRTQEEKDGEVASLPLPLTQFHKNYGQGFSHDGVPVQRNGWGRS